MVEMATLMATRHEAEAAIFVVRIIEVNDRVNVSGTLVLVKRRGLMQREVHTRLKRLDIQLRVKQIHSRADKIRHYFNKQRISHRTTPGRRVEMQVMQRREHRALLDVRADVHLTPRSCPTLCRGCPRLNELVQFATQALNFRVGE